MNTPTLQQIQKRAERVWFDDGLWDIAFGVILFLIGVIGLIVWRFRPEGPLGLILTLLQLGVLLGGFYALNGILRSLKERITYPRVGYVVYRKPTGSNKRRRMLTSFFIAAFVGGLVGLLSSLQQTEAYIPVITAAIFAAAALYLGIRFGLLRYGINSILILIAGGWISFLHMSDDLDVAVFFCIVGSLWIVAGSITLVHFLRFTPVAEVEDLTSEER